jgi:hypothetical protein
MKTVAEQRLVMTVTDRDRVYYSDWGGDKRS